MRITTASVLALVAAKNGSPEAAMVAAAGTELTAAMVDRMVQEFRGLRGGRVRRVLLGASDRAGEGVDAFVRHLLGDEQLRQILYDTLAIAADEAWERKLTELSEVLRRVHRAPDAIDEEQIFLRVLAEVDEVHVRALAKIRQHVRRVQHALGGEKPTATGDEPWIRYSTADLAHDLGLQTAVGTTVVMKLAGLGCVHLNQTWMREPGLGTVLREPEQFEVLETAFGQYVLDRLS